MFKHILKRLTGVISIVLLLNACSKDDQGPIQFSSDSIQGMLYYYEDESLGRIRLLDLESEIRRGYTLNASAGVTLQAICDDRSQLVLKAYKAPTISPAFNDGARFVKPYQGESGWMFTSNVIPGLISVDDDDWYDIHMNPDKFHAFKFHEMGEVNGEKEYAIESIYFPGHYIAYSGHPIQGTNTISYVEFPELDDAPRWRLFKPAGAYLEGNINLISTP